MPIDKIEFLLKRIFKKYCIEVLREGTSFNGVYVVVRVHYQNPITGQMDFHDGIGATQLQTAKGTSPADLVNINNGALAMAYPLAKTVAIKDACDHFGKSFGSDLNRKDTLDYGIDNKLVKLEPLDESVKEQWENELQNQKTIDDLEKLRKQSKVTNKSILQLFEIRKSQINAGV